MKKFAIFLGGLIVIAALSAGWFLYNKPHRRVATEKPAYMLNASQLFTEFEEDEPSAHSRYNEQVIEISGNLGKVAQNTEGTAVALIRTDLGFINCEMTESYDDLLTLEIGQPVSIKGLYIGFDDLLGEIQLKNCILTSH